PFHFLPWPELERNVSRRVHLNSFPRPRSVYLIHPLVCPNPAQRASSPVRGVSFRGGSMMRPWRRRHAEILNTPRGNNGATMPGADDAFPAESRTTVFFGAVTSKSEPLTFQESLGFVKKVKARNYMLYLSLFDILGRTELSQLEAYQTLQLLFRDHPDLHEGLEKFRPPMPAKHAAVNSNLWPWVFACAAVPLVAMSLIPALGNPVLWLVQQTLGEKMRAA
uniref:Uncharacterized protein n=4 Tax=Aegilops tauschii subsp. strangulata TaxID=200361 RepID=A0A453DN94_AEGTS